MQRPRHRVRGRSLSARRLRLRHPAKHCRHVPAGTASIPNPWQTGTKVSVATGAAHRSQHELECTGEEKMNKSLVALIGTLIAAATMFASSAEAGLKIKFGFGGGFPAFHSHNGGGHAHRHYQRKRYVARRVAKKTVVAKKSTPSVSKVAKVDKKVSKPEVVATAPVTDEVEIIADNENSSIAGASEPIKTSAIAEPETEIPVAVKADASSANGEAKPDKTAGKLDCKKFFPSVGMTLSVRCE
jgi:hypothetical protein